MIVRKCDSVGDGWIVKRVERKGVEYIGRYQYVVDLIVLQRGRDFRHWVRMVAL
jgi:hypothetical protein